MWFINSEHIINAVINIRHLHDKINKIIIVNRKDSEKPVHSSNHIKALANGYVLTL